MFMREDGNDGAMIALNFGNQPTKLAREDLTGKVLVSSCLDREGERVHRAVDLRANEGIVIALAEDV
jgi:alpha-glucosidase